MFFMDRFVMKKLLLITYLIVIACDPAPVEEKADATTEPEKTKGQICYERCAGEVKCIAECEGHGETTTADVEKTIPPGTYWNVDMEKVSRDKGVGIVSGIPGETAVEFNFDFTAKEKFKQKISLVDNSESGNYNSTYVTDGSSDTGVVIDPDSDTILKPSETDTPLIKPMILCRCFMPQSIRVVNNTELIKASAKEANVEVPPLSGDGIITREMKNTADPKALSYVDCSEIGYKMPIKVSDDASRPERKDSDGNVYQQPYRATVVDRFNVNGFNEKVDQVFRSSIYEREIQTVEEIAYGRDPSRFMDSPLGQIISQNLPILTVRYAAAGCQANNCPPCMEAEAIISPLFQFARETLDEKGVIKIGPNYQFPTDAIKKSSGWVFSEPALVPETMFHLIVNKIETENPDIKKTYDILEGVSDLIELYRVLDPFGDSEE